MSTSRGEATNKQLARVVARDVAEACEVVVGQGGQLLKQPQDIQQVLEVMGLAVHQHQRLASPFHSPLERIYGERRRRKEYMPISKLQTFLAFVVSSEHISVSKNEKSKEH